MPSTLVRICTAASCAAPAAMIAVREPPVPGPHGVNAVSPWMNTMSSIAQPRCSATIWAMVVSVLCPWLAVPMIRVTTPVGSIRTIAPSLAIEPPVCDGST